ncbi:MAG: AmmeMemoRadiSam system protein A [Caldisphaera sp.]|jgi:AmmeMemoRadiSam system protein A|nr:AmmeMemoRadiSam system protein A [Caldisphaera sp.]PMP60614.1 MAG: AMMECR1 domain-containing protein [Caldisphaera sp.]PMP89808.1 MAG: AMMECR1 domain-containing protein [Caldisphaera sp.]
MQDEAINKPIDPDEIDDETGALLVKIARQSVEYYFKNKAIMSTPSYIPKILQRPGAAFVTIDTYYSENQSSLRGCIGYIEPIKPLINTVMEVSLEAAFNDPRFNPMDEREINFVTFEVSVLSKLEASPSDKIGRLNFIVIGRDGLVIERGYNRGLLLPQVPVENLWDKETFLSETCIKAGLWPDCWLDNKTKVYRYRAMAWKEVKPNGIIIRRDLAKEYEKLINKHESI